MNRFLLLPLCVLLHHILFAQDVPVVKVAPITSNTTVASVVKEGYLDNNWSAHPKLHKVDPEFKDFPIVYIQDSREIYFKSFLGLFKPYKKVNKILKVQNLEGVKLMKNFSIDPLFKVRRSFKARIIFPDGKVKVLKTEDLNFENDTEETGLVVSFNEIEIGCEIEYSYEIYSQPVYVSREYYQGEYPIIHMNFKMTPSEDVSYIVKSYNGLNPPTQSEGTLMVVDSNIEGRSKGFLKYNRSQLKHIDYKFKGINDSEDAITWDKISESQLKMFETSTGGGKVSKFLKGLRLDTLPSTSEKILTLENAIKRTIKLSAKSDSEYKDLGQILKNKISNPYGLSILYLKCFKLLDVDVDVVLASSRFNGEVDLFFPHGLDLEVMMFYVKEIDQYLTPFDMSVRLGFPPYPYGSTMALSILTENNTLNSSLEYKSYEFRELPIMSSGVNKTQTSQFIVLNKELDSLKIKTHVVKTGVPAFEGRFKLEGEELNLPDQFKNEEKSPIIHIRSNYKNKEVEKNNSNPKMPFIEKYQSISTEYIIKDDNHVYIELGKLMKDQLSDQFKLEGEQNVLIKYPLTNLVNMSLSIPKGYICENLDQLPKSIKLDIEGKSMVEFNLEQSLVNNTLSLKIKEAYHILEINQSYYSEYKSIYDSLSKLKDFVLILKKN